MVHRNCNCVHCAMEKETLNTTAKDIAKQFKMMMDYKDGKIIKFYIRTKPFGFLSNFHRARQVVDGVAYLTNEHYYQSMKAKDPAIRRWIGESPKAWHSMKMGRLLRENEMVDGWEEKKVEVMLTGLRAKFQQNHNLMMMLLNTGDKMLIEDSPTDMFWGGSLPSSENMLGNLLMQVRTELQDRKTCGHCNNYNGNTCLAIDIVMPEGHENQAIKPTAPAKEICGGEHWIGKIEIKDNIDTKGSGINEER